MVFGSRADFNGLRLPIHGNLEVDKTREFCHFWPLSWASTWFLAPGMISTARDPRYTEIWKSTKLVNLSFLAVFLGYSTRFLSLGMISMKCDPRYRIIWKSTKSIILSFLAVFMGYSTRFLARPEHLSGETLDPLEKTLAFPSTAGTGVERG